MNSKFHKAQAEGLIKQYNDGRMIYPERGLALAQVHATLALIPDEQENNNG